MDSTITCNSLTMRSESEVNGNQHHHSNGGIRIGIEVASQLAKVYASDSYLSLASNGDYCATSTSSSSLPSPSSDQVPHVSIHIDENAVIEGAKKILQAIRPNWDQSLVVFKKFTDGITNKLVGCFYSPGSLSASSSPCNNTAPKKYVGSSDLCSVEESYTSTVTLEDSNDSGHMSSTEDSVQNVVLIRVYGNKTDLLIDREKEIQNIKLLHSYGFAPSLYATFLNGLAYEFVPGVTLNRENVLETELWTLVAKRMANMHRMVHAMGYGETGGQQQNPKPMLLKKIERFFELVPQQYSDKRKHSRLAATFLPIERMRQQFYGLYRRLEELGSPVVFSHNDLLLGNIVYTQCLHSVTFIDYEYADYNFQAFDIGNHFAEFAGVDTVDYSRYPSKEFQLRWLRVYLENFLGSNEINPADIEQLYVQVNQFALAAHFFWTIWSLVQAEYSTIDFDYVEYAFLRYNEYLAKKDEFLALKEDAK